MVLYLSRNIIYNPCSLIFLDDKRFFKLACVSIENTSHLSIIVLDSGEDRRLVGLVKNIYNIPIIKLVKFKILPILEIFS